MSARVLRGLLSPSQPFVCLSCRRQIARVEGGRTRTYKYTTLKGNNEGTKKSELSQEPVGKLDSPTSASRSRIRDIIQGFVRGEGENGGKNRETKDGSTQDLAAGSTAEANVSFRICSQCYDSRAGLLENHG